MPVRVRLSRRKGFRLPASAVNVARPTPWGNPFKVGLDGTTAECVDLYAKMLAGYICLTTKCPTQAQLTAREHVIGHLDELRGKDLACWCALDKPCHADVLLKIANAKEKQP